MRQGPALTHVTEESPEAGKVGGARGRHDPEETVRGKGLPGEKMSHHSARLGFSGLRESEPGPVLLLPLSLLMSCHHRSPHSGCPSQV